MEPEPLDRVADWLARLPGEPPRRALVLVPDERHAHAVRRHVCVRRGRAEHLAGVRLLTPPGFARELLARAGVAAVPGGEAIRRLRLVQLFESASLDGSLRYFDAAQLRGAAGFADAFARAIEDLEAAGFDPPLALLVSERLAAGDALAAARLHDLAVAWERADEGGLWTASSLLARATAALTANCRVAAGFGPVFAWLAAPPSTRLLRFLAALPECSVCFEDARPLRTDTQRWRPALAALYPVLEGTHAEPPTTELQLVRRYLFEAPEVLTDPRRPRSPGADGSVELEEFPGVDLEIEAAAQWVAECIGAGVRAERIAVVVPDVDAYASGLADRLARTAAGGAAAPGVHVAGGLTVGSSPAGLRLLAVLRAISRRLELEATLRILPFLRHPNEGNDGGAARRSPSKVAALVYAAGILGGRPGAGVEGEGGTGEWVPRLGRLRDGLRATVAEHDARLAGGGPPPSHAPAAEYQQAKRRLRDVESLLPAVSALQSCARRLLEGAPLDVVWREMQAFCRRWVHMPDDPPDLTRLLEAQLDPLLADPAARELRGLAAVGFLAEVVRRCRRPASRFGAPCVFVGTPAQAAGLPFEAVRVLGLAEGVLPHTAHDDPIVPDALRRRLEEESRALHPDIVLPRLADRVLDEIHDVFRVVAGARDRLSLSAPRQWADRSERAVSGIMLEAATALGRPGDGPDEGDVPTAARLRSAYFHAVSMRSPPLVAARAVLASAPRFETGAIAVPAGWTDAGALALDRLAGLVAARELPRRAPAAEGEVVANEAGTASLAGMEGTVSGAWDGARPPGLESRRPLSATAVRGFLECPHRFLLERILYRHEPPPRPSGDVIDPVVYGILFHRAAEQFFRAHGTAFCRHEGTIEAWLARARGIAAQRFEEASAAYALRGADGVARERDRLLRQIDLLVRYEWQLPVREFVACELEFGDPAAVPLPVEGGTVHVRGSIDRVDRVGPAAFAVRDLKTGRVVDFGELPIDALHDVQIGLYVLALEAAGTIAPGGTSVAAYVHPSAAGVPERSFVGGDLELLRRRCVEWLAVVRDLLAAGIFPRTPNPEDCSRCSFLPVCGEGAARDSAARLARLPAGNPGRAFAQLRRRAAEAER